jgi:hypothetical protein
MIIRDEGENFWRIDIGELSIHFRRDQTDIEDYLIGNGFFHDEEMIYYSIGFTDVINRRIEEVSTFSVYGGLTTLQHSSLLSYDQRLLCDAMRHDRNVSSRHFILNCFLKHWNSLGGHDNFSLSDLKLEKKSYFEFMINRKPLFKYINYSVPKMFYYLSSHFASPTGIIDNLIPFIRPLHDRQLSLISKKEGIDPPFFNWIIEDKNHISISSFNLSYDHKHKFKLIDYDGCTHLLIKDYLNKLNL